MCYIAAPASRNAYLGKKGTALFVDSNFGTRTRVCSCDGSEYASGTSANNYYLQAG